MARHIVELAGATLAALAGCTGGIEGEGNDESSHRDVTEPDLTSSACTRPALDAPWVQPLLIDTIEKLTTMPRAEDWQRGGARSKLAYALGIMGMRPQRQTYATGVNLYATFPATHGAGPQIVIGAHLDSAAGSPGANDNASGVAVVFTLARYLAALPCRSSPVTIVFFEQEEAGARAFAQLLAPGSVRAVHTIDQVAWDADGDRVLELELPTPELAADWQSAAAALDVPVAITRTTRAAHRAFRDAGFPAVGLSEEYAGGDTSPHRGRSTDTAASVRPYIPYLMRAAQLTARVVADELQP